MKLRLSQFWLDRAEEEKNWGTRHVSNTSSSLTQQKVPGWLLPHGCPWYWVATGCWGAWWGARPSWPQASLTQALASKPPPLKLHLASLTQFVITLASSFTKLFTPCWSDNLFLNAWLDFEGSKVVLQIRKVVVCLLLKAFSPKSFLGQLSHFSRHTAWPGLQWAAGRDTQALTSFGFISKVSALCWCCQSWHTVL